MRPIHLQVTECMQNISPLQNGIHSKHVIESNLKNDTESVHDNTVHEGRALY